LDDLFFGAKYQNQVTQNNNNQVNQNNNECAIYVIRVKSKLPAVTLHDDTTNSNNENLDIKHVHHLFEAGKLWILQFTQRKFQFNPSLYPE